MSIDAFWNKFITECPTYQDSSYTAWQFGVNATHLAELVSQGIKTATTSGLAFYVEEQEPLPKVDDLSIVLDAQDNPICVIKNTKVYQVPFSEVSKEHAYKEGEGSRTLTYWRNVHRGFFIPEYANINQSFHENQIMVCEEFKCLYSI
ncbi:ASCH domain-containing protein [Staphylococcus simulans]|uniref:ASCH domain-containing protein n=1 Tax=Staphylococcus simulans TaxID=1286 RepID=UPI001E4AD183|nr:ASCH domain-containing protein [Staphylococcus simulans]MCD8913947.1 ASCH domain-containing protein [Staphylococcus simulans]